MLTADWLDNSISFLSDLFDEQIGLKNFLSNLGKFQFRRLKNNTIEIGHQIPISIALPQPSKLKLAKVARFDKIIFLIRNFVESCHFFDSQFMSNICS